MRPEASQPPAGMALGMVRPQRPPTGPSKPSAGCQKAPGDGTSHDLVLSLHYRRRRGQGQACSSSRRRRCVGAALLVMGARGRACGTHKPLIGTVQGGPRRAACSMGAEDGGAWRDAATWRSGGPCAASPSCSSSSPVRGICMHPQRCA